MEVINGVTYETVKVYPNGDVAYGHGCKPTQEQLDDLDKFISRIWDGFTEEQRIEINRETRARRNKYIADKRA